MTTFWTLVEAAARERADAVILADDFGRSLTSAAFLDAAERVAAAISGQGVTSGDVVSWQLPTTLEAAVLMGALSRLGAIQNPIIPVLRDREVGFILNQVTSRLLVVPEVWRGFAYGEMARSLPAGVLALDFDADPAVGMRLPGGAATDLLPPPTGSGECRWIYYSSGTTADPKGARHTDAGVLASSNGMVDGMGLHAGDVYPIAWPFAHIGGVAMLAAALRTGATLVLFDGFDPTTTAERMASHKPTVLGSATPFFIAYVAAQRRHGDEPLYPALRACVAGGAPTPATVNREVAEALGVPGIIGAWGLTEFPVATSETVDDPELGSTVGRAVANVEVRVVDGELRLKGPQCFLGYVDPSLDEAAFDEEGWFRTGDLGTVGADGRVRIEGRIKDVIIRNAENIAAVEVEEAVLRHPAVADVAVVGVPDDRTGERVCAVVVLAPGQSLTLAEVVDHCRGEGLAPYKCPERLELVEALPRNLMGKVLKREISKGLVG